MSTPEVWLGSAEGLLKVLIQEQGFTQQDVQKALGWGRSYVSQALGKGKKLRLEVVLQILFVIGVEPEDFFSRWSREVQLKTEPEGCQGPDAGKGQPGEVDRLRGFVATIARFVVDNEKLVANAMEAALSRQTG